MNQEEQNIWNLLGNASRTSAPDNFSRSVMDRIAREDSSVCTDGGSCWQSRKAVFAIAATLVAMVGVLSLLFSSYESHQEQELLAQLDESTVLDVAYLSLGDDYLRDAVSALSTDDALACVSTEHSLLELIF